MVWAGVVLLALYVGLQVGACAVSVRPYRIPTWISPGALGCAQEEVEFVSGDGVKLRGWWSPTPGSDKIAVFFHGYMMNRSEFVPEAFHLAERGFSCLLIDFRAHGKSGYSKSSIGFNERQDARAAVEFARSRQPGSRMLLVGSSMGSAAVAFALADDPQLGDAAVIDSGYSRLIDAIPGWWRFLGGKFLAAFLYPTRWIAGPIFGIDPFKVDVAEALVRIGPKPLLFFHGRCDTLASPAGAERNFSAAVGPKEIEWFDSCNHSEGRWMQADKYQARLLAWLDKIGM